MERDELRDNRIWDQNAFLSLCLSSDCLVLLFNASVLFDAIVILMVYSVQCTHTLCRQ